MLAEISIWEMCFPLSFSVFISGLNWRPSSDIYKLNITDEKLNSVF